MLSRKITKTFQPLTHAARRAWLRKYAKVEKQVCARYTLGIPWMSLPIVILIGALLGGLSGASIFFEPKEPVQMANPLCGNLERRIDCASYRLFDSCNYTMVVRHDHRRALRFRLRSRDLSRQGRSEIRRRALCDPERNYHRRIDRPFYRHVGHQNDLITPNV